MDQRIAARTGRLILRWLREGVPVIGATGHQTRNTDGTPLFRPPNQQEVAVIVSFLRHTQRPGSKSSLSTPSGPTVSDLVQEMMKHPDADAANRTTPGDDAGQFDDEDEGDEGEDGDDDE